MALKKLNPIEHIELKDITLGFKGADPLFEDLSISLPMNKNIRVVGATGVGKTALLKMFIALILPQKGQYLINGNSVGDMSFEEFTSYRLNIGYSFEYGGLLNNKTLLENILLPAQYHLNYDSRDSKKRVISLMERCEIIKSAHMRPSMVPGSHRKMAVVLRAFVMRPQLLLLDEPSAGLTFDGQRFIIDLISEERKAGFLKNVIFCSNNHRFIEDLAETNLYLKNKKIISAVQALNKEAVG